MKLKNLTRTSLILVLAASITLPHLAMANPTSSKSVLSIFDEDTTDTGIIPSNPTIPNNGTGTNNGGNNGTNNGNGNNNGNNGNNGGGGIFPGNGQRPGNNGNNGNSGNNGGFNTNPFAPNTNNGTTIVNGRVTMAKATVTTAYACPLFSSPAHADLIKSIDELTKQVNITPECSSESSVKSIEANNKTIKTNITALEAMMKATDPSTLSVDAVSSTMTGTLQALGSLSDTLNSQSFLNSNCGRQTMSAGKALLAFNDMINGLTPYALFAVSVNAALAPALPFVVGAAIATTGISVMGKMFDENAMDLTNPIQREAVLVNICQYTKVAAKVRFMQLAQSGKIDKITAELGKGVDLYSAELTKRSGKISELLKYRASIDSNITAIETQLNNDNQDLASVQEQIATNKDDFTTCTFARELVNWAADGKSFPASAYVNLEKSSAQMDRATKLRVLSERTLHENSMRKLISLGDKTMTSDATLKSCSEVGKAWIASMGRSVKLTSAILGVQKNQLENELSQNTEYRDWKTRYNFIEQQRLTVERVSKAMADLADDNSIINRSELAQKMSVLKAGLFGEVRILQFKGGKPPVLQWIDHTKTKYDMAMSAFDSDMQALYSGAWSLTDTGRNIGAKSIKGAVYFDGKQRNRDEKIKETLGNFFLSDSAGFKLGSRQYDLACQQLENAWIDWTSAGDHLGAISFFCDMIDGVLDVNMDPRIIQACRGNQKLSGTTVYPSLVDDAIQTLTRRGFAQNANLVSRKLRELQCPVPSISVMNQ